jgi:signal transduction histidine kinase
MYEREGVQYLLANGPVIVHCCRAEDDYGITFISENIQAQLGYKPQNFYQTSRFWVQHIHPKDRPHFFAEVRQLLNAGHCQLEYRFLHADQTYRWVHHEMYLTRHKNGTKGEIAGLCMDISAWKEKEKELHDSHRQIRNLAVNLEWIREQERVRIARELHDVVGQEITILKLDLDRLRIDLKNGGRIKEEALWAIMKQVDGILQTVQRISTELRPAVLDKLGLCEAIKWQARCFKEHSGIDCRVSFPQGHVEPDKESAVALFRIFQEALTNVVRHAEATQVKVKFSRDNQSLWLIVEDNGRGITESAIKESQGFGLLGMRERTSVLGGELNVCRRPEGGTRISVRIPSKFS